MKRNYATKSSPSTSGTIIPNQSIVEVSEETQEKVKLQCHNYLAKRVSGEIKHVNVVRAVFSSSKYLESVIIECPYCDTNPDDNLVKISIDRTRKIHRATLVNFTKHLKLKHRRSEDTGQANKISNYFVQSSTSSITNETDDNSEDSSISDHDLRSEEVPAKKQKIQVKKN